MRNTRHNDVAPDRAAPCCDDQLPLFSRVGRGIRGDSSRIRIADPDTTNETHLEGIVVDGATGEIRSEWISENINGGELSYQYNLRPYTIPRTFTITFMYRRPGRPEWSWTTPAIPYIWTVDDEGEQENPDAIVGSGVATLFVRQNKDSEWVERLNYPEGTTREDFNAPLPDEPWASTITFGVGGDIEIPDLNDLAKVIGITVENIKNIIAGGSFEVDGEAFENLKDYIDKKDDGILNHIHKDLGFNSYPHAGTGAFGGNDTVKAYIDAKVADATKNLKNALQAMVNKTYPGGTVNDDGTITWNSPANSAAMKIPMGNINILSPDRSLAILTSAGDEVGDAKVE